MTCSQNSINILTALQFKGIGPGKIVSNWHTHMADEEVLFLVNSFTTGEHISMNELLRTKEVVTRLVESNEPYIDGVVSLGEENFPFCRGNVNSGDYPVVLFYKGDIQLLKPASKNVAVIGVLMPEDSIAQREQNMVSALLRNNYVIVSGLALGCDSIAHKQALAENGRTIAILPSTLKTILPSQNQQLAEGIYKNKGLLITEYYKEPESNMELRGRYQERDRLQAMFSDAIILTASYDLNKEGNDSGSRLAMNYAKKYRIPRYVMYNETTDCSHPQFELNRRILREGNSTILTHTNIKTLCEREENQLKIF